MTHHNEQIDTVSKLACAVALALGLMTSACAATNNAAGDNQGAEATSQSEDAQAKTPEVTTTDRPYEDNPKAESTKKLGKLDITAVQAKKARSFITVFVATHVRNPDKKIAPMEMTQEDWVSNCMAYVDPDSDLGKTFKDNPESLRSPYGAHDQRVVNATKVSASGEDNAALVTATIEATTQGWDKSSLHKEIYLVRFGDSNLVTAVEPRGLQATT